MRFTLTRLKSPLLAVFAIAAGLVVVDIVLRCALGADPSWMPPRLYNYVPYFGGRIARIEQLKRDGQIDDRHLAIVLGLSSVQHGLNPLALEQNDSQGRRWLVMGAAGGTVVDLEIAAQPFMSSSLHPSLIVIGIHPWMLHRNDYMEHHTTLSWISRYSWLVHHHYALNSLILIQRDRSKATVGQILKLPLWEVYEPEPDPWQNSSDFPTEIAPRDEMASQWAGLQFELDPDQYHDNDVELNSLHRLISQLRDHCQRLVCVLMPESSSMRPSPLAVEASFRRAVAALDRPLEIIDLRSSMPDSFLHDFTHLNSAGRAEFSAMLPSAIH